MYKTIVVPIDLAHADRASLMIEAAKKLADDNCRMIFTNVIEEMPAHIVAELPDQYVRKSVAVATREMEQIARSAGLEAEVDIRVGHPAKAILAVADAHDAEAIVLASHRPDIHDYLLGSTAGRVVRHAKCTVVVIR